MKFLHQLTLLSLCAVLPLGMVCPVHAEGEPPQARVYRAADDSPYQIRFNRDIDFGLITRNIGEDDFSWDSGSDTFALLWDEGEFDAAVGRGETCLLYTSFWRRPGSTP